MPDNKQSCKTCKKRHYPPTGKKCQFKKDQDSADFHELSRDAAIASNIGGAQTGSQSGNGQPLQLRILEQLKKVTERLNKVEDRMAVNTALAEQSTPKIELSRDSFIVKSKDSKKYKKSAHITSDSSLDESDRPSLELLRSQQLQRKVDRCIRDLEQSSHIQVKSLKKRGGGIDVVVKHRVHWPQEAILGGVNRSFMTNSP